MKILFVCAGNTCRSPMAEALFRHLSVSLKTPLIVSSAGICAMPGLPASSEAVKVMKELDIDISSHQSSFCGVELASSVDMLLTMTSQQRDYIHHKFKIPVWQLSYQARGEMKDIPDPFGSSSERYRECRDRILFYLEGLMEHIKKKEKE